MRRPRTSSADTLAADIEAALLARRAQQAASKRRRRKDGWIFNVEATEGRLAAMLVAAGALEEWDADDRAAVGAALQRLVEKLIAIAHADGDMSPVRNAIRALSLNEDDDDDESSG